MPQIVTIGPGGDYSTVASWVASSDYSTDWGVGNPATGRITGKITEAVTINTANTPNGALLTALPGEEYDGTNSATCAGLTSSSSTLVIRDLGIEVSNIFVETTAAVTAILLGAFEGVDANLYGVGCKTSLTGDNATGTQTYSGAAFTGNIENFACEGAGGYGIRFRNDVTGTIDHITIVDAAANGSGFRDGIRNEGSSTTIVITNTLVILASTASGSASAFDGTWGSGSDFNAGDDTSAPGANSLDNRTTADLADYAGGDFRTASASALATAGSGGTYIGFALETSSGISITPDSVNSGQLISSPTLSQNYTFSVDDISSLQSISNASLTQQNTLSVDGVTLLQDISNSSLVVSGALGVNDIDSLQSITEPLLTQAHILSVDNIETGQTLSNVLLAVAGALEVQGLSQSQILSNISLVQNYLLSVDDLSQPQLLSDVTLGVEGVLSVDSILSQQTISNSSLITQVALLTDNITNQQFISVVSFDKEQSIGTVTASFKEDDISVKYGILNITVQFKE